MRTAQFGVFQTEIGQQLRIEEARNKEASHAFFKYAQRWWKEYTEIHPHFKHRRVKIFAEDELGLLLRARRWAGAGERKELTVPSHIPYAAQWCLSSDKAALRTFLWRMSAAGREQR